MFRKFLQTSRQKWLTATAVLIILLGGAAALVITNPFDGSDPSPGGDDMVSPSPRFTGSETTDVAGIEDAAAAGSDTVSGSALQFRLSEGKAQPQTAVTIPLAAGTPLTEAEIQQILSRLPALMAQESDAVGFNLPPETLPAPRPGATITETFPPPAPDIAPTSADAGPLEVLRFSPEGEIPVAPFLNVTFNQPMVPLTSLEALSAADVPVQLTPSIPGVWKWISPQTLRFEYEGDAGDSFPMATVYEAEIPAGTLSASGNALAEPLRWTFSTPPPQVTNFYPQHGPQPLQPIIFVAFDQQVDPTAVLTTIRLEANGRSQTIRLATDAEIAADERVSTLVANGRPNQFFAFRPDEPLPTSADVRVTIGPGTPSAEGPRTTETTQVYNFVTYDPLEITEHRCGWGDECPPLAPFYIHFNNALDTVAYDETMVTIDPPIANATIDIDHSTLIIRGLTEGRTTYRVTVSGDIKDVFGQTLGRDETLSFRVGSASPLLVGPEQNMVTVDPSLETPQLSLYTINYDQLTVRAYAVNPADWPAFLRYRDQLYRDNPPTPPGTEVLNTTIDIDSQEDVLTETAVDLTDALSAETGHLIVYVEPVEPRLSLDRNRRQYKLAHWVQVTSIGLDAYADHSELVAWATDLQTGAPLADTAVQFGANRASATTNDAGIARLSLPGGGAGFITATRGDDVALLPANTYFIDDNTWSRRTPQDTLRWYIFDDRQMYRPGEEVHVKGWLRLVGGGQTGDVGLVGERVTAVSYTLYDSRGNEFGTGQLEINALGGFDTAFTLPDNINLGHVEMSLSAVGSTSNLDGTRSGHTFQVQEFRRPEFEVMARNETTGPYYVGDQATVATSAAYFAGGPLPNAEVNWDVTASPASYSPPNWSAFTFGNWQPWWFYDIGYEADIYEPGFPGGGEGTIYESFVGVTDAAGEHFLQLDFEELAGVRPYSIMAQATVFDVNRQAWAATTSLLVHPAQLYVGMRSERTFVRQGTPLDIETIVADVDGQAIAGRDMTIEAARLEWRSRNGRWQEEEADVQTCTVISAAEPVSCSFETAQGGQYRITATVTDDNGRSHQSQLTRWVSGGRRPTSRQIEQESVVLIPDKQSYQPGDVAEILVQAPFSPAEGLLTVSRSGIVTTERFQVAEDTTTLQIPIEDGHIPNLHVQVDLVGETPRTNDSGQPLESVPSRPAYASGNLTLDIPPLSRNLSLQITPQATELAPGEETAMSVTVTDAGGQPVADAELAVMIVDEAVLALSNYQLQDPLDAFYWQRSPDLRSTYGRATIVLANPDTLADQVQSNEVARVVTEAVEESEEMAMDMAMVAEAPAGMGADDGAAGDPITVRTNFNPLATFAPDVRTNASGSATVNVQLPDNLTRYRIMVVAVAGGKQFGSGEATLTARLPLMVRPSVPRFLNFGDQFEFPVVVQNQTDAEMAVSVVLNSTNLSLTDDAGRLVMVPANDRVEVRFPMTTLEAGTARYQVAAVSGAYADAADGDLPVYTPATTEAFATYGVLDEGAVAQPLVIPDGLYPQFGGLEINTSSTALQALTDAVIYLTSYPYDCSEQLASRIMAVAALRDVLTAFEADGLPTPAELETAVQRDIDRLQALQNGDGGWPIWTRGRESVPFYSIHVAHALVRAREKGFVVDEGTLAMARDHLRNIESAYPSWYSQSLRWNLSAYALYVRDLMGDADAGKAQSLFLEAGLDNLSLEAVAWLWPTLADGGYSEQVVAIERHLQNRVVETAAAANFTTSYGDDDYLMLHSNRRTDGVILDALIDRDPASDLIPKIVNGLLAQRTNGRWANTQENVFILLALDRYFNTFEAETPEFVARVWLGDTYAAQHEFVGRTTERRQTDVPLSFIIDAFGGETADIIVAKEGPGRLYYRLGLSYAPTDLDLDPLDMGFTVSRVYEGVDNPDDVVLREDGTWEIRAGARVRVTVNMITNNRRYHVALADPLPAGLEIINPALAFSGDVPSNPAEITPRFWWWGPWYEHQNLRDQRAEAFATLLWEGVYEYSYITRATTPGNFIVPPAKAEEMYAPEVFGRSGTDRVVVVP